MPLANSADDKIRRLQVKLYQAAKQSPARRFHALYDKIYRDDILHRAWDQVRQNQGAAGIDGVTIAQIEAAGVDPLLTELAEELRQSDIILCRAVECGFRNRRGINARWACQR